MTMRATYRLQLHADFTLADAHARLDYFARLGISHLYLAPIFQARPGSTHGYDVIDPTRVSEELGGEAALRALAEAAHQRMIGLILDIVPNHMAATSDNPWWADVLRRGGASTHVSVFDTPLAHGATRMRLPVLGVALDEAIDNGELVVDADDGSAPLLRYHDHTFPLSADAAAAHAAEPGPAGVRAALAASPYEPVHWLTVAREVCYRRFFDITELVAVRVEDPAVFERTHALVLRLVREGVVDGLRIDHIDGLRDPAAYLDQLHRTAVGPDGRPVPVLVEKILAPDETLPAGWQTVGTTGYEFARWATSWLLDPDGYRRFDQARAAHTGDDVPFETFARERKRRVLDRLFPAELGDLAESILPLVHGHCPGTSVADCRTVLRELTACLDVYRTYITETGPAQTDRRRIDEAARAARAQLPALADVVDVVTGVLTLDDATVGDEPLRPLALEVVQRWQQLSGPAMAKGFEDTALYAWPSLLAVNEVGGEPAHPVLSTAELHEILSRRADHEPQAMSALSTHDTKRSEDVRARLVALAGHADDWMTTLDDMVRTLHRLDPNEELAARDALTLLQTVVGAWPLDGHVNESFAGRVEAYMLKAAREAKEETSWRRQNSAYEEMLQRTTRAALLAPEAVGLRRMLRRAADQCALHGMLDSLMQVALRATAPGVPDVYQGTELWRLDLVDPDNRRPVDYDHRSALLDTLEEELRAPSAHGCRALLEQWRDGRIKLFVEAMLLRARATHPALVEGGYRGVRVEGLRADHVLSFLRTHPTGDVLTVLTRWPGRLSPADGMPLGSAWQDTVVRVADAGGAWRDLLTGRVVRAGHGVSLAELLETLPFAVLTPA